MAETIGFRPNIDKREDFEIILAWCKKNQSSFNSIINSFLPAIAYILQNQVSQRGDHRYLTADLGEILLREPAPYLREGRDGPASSTIMLQILRRNYNKNHQE